MNERITLVEEVVGLAIPIAAGVLTWRASASVILTIIAAIVGLLIGIFVSYLIHQSRRKREMGFSSMRELNEFDSAINDIRSRVASEVREEVAEAEEEARRQGYASLEAKRVAELREKARAYREGNNTEE